MYGRTTHFKTRAGQLEAITSKIPGIKEHLSNVPGMVLDYVMWDDDGVGMVIAVYESEAAADAASAQIGAVWAGLAEYLAEPPVTAVYNNVENMLG